MQVIVDEAWNKDLCHFKDAEAEIRELRGITERIQSYSGMTEESEDDANL